MKYLEQYKQLHKLGKFGGGSLKKHLPNIERLLKDTKSKSVLDYGCGKAKHHPKGWVGYDPAVKDKDILPGGTFDAVICTDVLEHVPEEELNETLNNIFSKAEKLVYLSISTKPAKKNLPNGENCHVTVKDKDWWWEQIGPFIKLQTVSINFD